MLSENDIVAVDCFLKDSGIVDILEPWYRIKTAINIAMVPCPHYEKGLTCSCGFNPSKCGSEACKIARHQDVV